MSIKQLDLFGNEHDVPCKKELKTFILALNYKGRFCCIKEVKAYSEKQAVYLFFKEDKTNRQYQVSYVYEKK